MPTSLRAIVMAALVTPAWLAHADVLSTRAPAKPDYCLPSATPPLISVPLLPAAPLPAAPQTPPPGGPDSA